MNNVFITRVIPEVGLELLRNAGCTITQFTEKRNLTQAELIQACQKNDALLCANFNVLDATFLNACRHLKVISLMSVGYDHVDITEATRLKIPVGNTPDVLSIATADTAFLLMLAVSRKAFYLHKTILAGQWGTFEPTANLGIDISHKTLGIFGLGKIGYELARKCIGAFDMKVIYYNRKANEKAERELGALRVTFEELLQQSDILSVHANLSTETRGFFNKEVFKQMRPGSIFINTARGGIHNEADLTEALLDGTLWGAGLDVTNPEPMSKDNVLLNMPGVCILPHIGSGTVETRNKMATIAARNTLAGLNNERLLHSVNPELYNLKQ